MIRQWTEGGRCFFRFLSAEIMSRVRSKLPNADVTLYSEFCHKRAAFEVVQTADQKRMGVPICRECAPQLRDMLEVELNRGAEA